MGGRSARIGETVGADLQTQGRRRATVAHQGPGGRVATMATQVCDVDVEEMSVEDAHAAFEAQALDALGVSREDFLTALDSGEYDDTDREDVIRLRMLAPFAR